MTWFSECRVRSLAEHIAPKIAPMVEAAIMQTIRAELPALLMAELRLEIPEFTPKMSGRRDRRASIKAEFNGRNQRELAEKYSMSRSQIYRILKTP